MLDKFYGSPAELIAEWCGVGLATANTSKTGRLKSGKAAGELFRRHWELRRARPNVTKVTNTTPDMNASGVGQGSEPWHDGGP
jgi:hypothetical protein